MIHFSIGFYCIEQNMILIYLIRSEQKIQLAWFGIHWQSRDKQCPNLVSNRIWNEKKNAKKMIEIKIQSVLIKINYSMLGALRVPSVQRDQFLEHK